MIKTGVNIFRCFKSNKNVITGLSKFDQCFRSQRVSIPNQLWSRNIMMFSQKMNKQQYEHLKKQGQQFYSNQVEQIIELEKSQDWQKVMGQIMQNPVIVDFYADWCQPCKILTPKLQQRVKNMENIRLVKVNIDKCQQLAHAMQIKSVPTVYLVFQNQAIDRFQGAIGEAQLDKFFASASKIRALFDNYTVQVKKLDEAKQLMSKEKFKQAQEVLISIKNAEKDIIAIKQIFLAQVYASKKQISKFKSQVQIIKTYEQMYQHNQDLKKFYEILVIQSEEYEQEVNQNIQIKSLKQEIMSDPQNLQLIFSLATAYKKYQMLQNSLQEALRIIKKDKNWQEKKAQKFVLDTFKQLGNASPITQKYRKLYQRMLN